MTKREKPRGGGSAVRQKRPQASSAKRLPAVPPVLEPLPTLELLGLLDNVKATVLALLASLQEKERVLRKRMRGKATAGVKTGLSDIRLLRCWADRTLRTIKTFERGNPEGLAPLLEELGEFTDILHAHDAEPPTLGSERL